MKRCLIVVPLYNESIALPHLISGFNDIQFREKNFKHDILFINDGSDDGSEEILIENSVNYVSLINNLGIGGAMQCGYIFAAKNGYDYVIQIDGDGQHPPGEILRLIAAAEKFDEDLIIGSRFISDIDYKPSIPRKLGMKYSSSLMRISTGIKIADTTSGFRLTKKDLVNYFAKEYPQQEAGLISLLMAAKAGFQFKEIPIKIDKRRYGKSSINILRAFLYPSKTMINSIAVAIRE